MLKYKVKEFINSGGQSRNYVPIEAGGMEKIIKYFDKTSAQKIQDEVIFAILLAFGERGQEHFKSLMHRECLIKKSVDSKGREYMRLKSLDSKIRRTGIFKTVCKSDVRYQDCFVRNRVVLENKTVYMTWN